MFVGVCAFGYLALSSRWTYAIPAAALIVGWSLIVRLKRNRDHLKHMAALQEAFAPLVMAVPELEDRYGHYGYPAFTLTFASEAALHEAEALGCIEAFKQAIQTLHAHVGGKQRPFDADMAVSIAYKEGQQSRFYYGRRS